MVSHKALFLFATTAFAATVHLSTRSPRSELILADLKNLDSSVLVLKAAISDYIGGVLDATPILLGITDVHLANRKTYYDSFIIGNQSVEDSKTIIDYVSNPIAIDSMKFPERLVSHIDQVLILHIQSSKHSRDHQEQEAALCGCWAERYGD